MKAVRNALFKMIQVTSLLFLVMSSSFVAADESRPSIEITPFGGYRLGSTISLDDPSYSQLKLGDGGLYGLAIGMGVEPAADSGEGMLEFMWTHQDSTLKAQPKPGFTQLSQDMKTDQFHLNGLYLPAGFERIRPYGMIGVGATRFAPSGDLDTATRFSWALGGGVKMPLTKRLGLRFEAKWDPALAQASGGVFCNSATGRCFVSSSGDLINQFDFLAGVSLQL